MKNVQIPETLFLSLVKYHLMDREELSAEISDGLEKKLEQMVMRELYSKYKTAPSKEEQEQARKEYLDRKGVPESYRW